MEELEFEIDKTVEETTGIPEDEFDDLYFTEEVIKNDTGMIVTHKLPDGRYLFCGPNNEVLDILEP